MSKAYNCKGKYEKLNHIHRTLDDYNGPVMTDLFYHAALAIEESDELLMMVKSRLGEIKFLYLAHMQLEIDKLKNENKEQPHGT